MTTTLPTDAVLVSSRGAAFLKPTEAREVIDGARRHSCERSDAAAWLMRLPDNSIDLLVTSPPYERARTYGIGEKMKAGQDWVDWIASLVAIASRKVRGLIVINCEGQTRQYRYSCAPFLLIADLHRRGFNLRKPPIFRRNGIPGSGGPDWLRNDYEPLICITRPGRLPWSNNVACGHAPKYALGGAMTNRGANGKRKQKRFGHDAEGRTKGSHERNICKTANPGNVLDIKVGGGLMGHPLAHENEAPFPLELPAFFIRSFCPPDGIVADPFSGSGTTAHAAAIHGRRFVGCDVRESQVSLTARRLEAVLAEQSKAVAS